MKQRIDLFDLSSELDLQKMEQTMANHPHTIETIYSPFLYLVWKNQFGTVKMNYFERSSKDDMKRAEDIMNSETVIFQKPDIMFPYAKLIITE